jgi:hypothetical protein
MSIEKLVAYALENNVVAMQECFEEEMSTRISIALDEKYKKMTKEDEDEDEDEDGEDDEDEDEDEVEESKAKKK